MSVAHFLNRELSWLAFNERVLEEASRTTLPILERAKFLAITASNLDEFFMVRVGGLQLLKDQGREQPDITGLTPSKQLQEVHARCSAFVTRQYTVLYESLAPELERQGIKRLRTVELTAAQRSWLQDYFIEQIAPVLSPIAIESGLQRSTLPALQIVLLCAVSGDQPRHLMVTLPSVLPRHISLPSSEGYQYMNLEDVVECFLPILLPGEPINGVLRFRISRNTDIAVDDENAYDLATEMEEVIEARRHSSTIRLEIQRGASAELITTVTELCGTPEQVYLIPGELDLRGYFSLSALPRQDHLRVEPWETQPSTAIQPGESMFEAIQRKDILLHHPYESFEPVVQLVEEAAQDADVVAIKQVLYRTAKNSRIIGALIQAARSGKAVTVLVELKARFDEARNLERAEELIQAGAQIIYGVRGLKTHAKITLVMRRESGRMVRYCHFGTGNYNEATAKMYTDISYLTCRADYGSDASAFFNTVTGRSRFQHFARLSMAPFGLRERLLAMISSETERSLRGEQAEILLKMNSLEDPQMIEALYVASHAGVKIRINVRGICCLRPGVKGFSENIRVVSIIDRYLEHARIFAFRQGGSHVVFISSADFMNRNLSKRVELLIPIQDSAAKKRLLTILDNHFGDTAQAHELLSTGIYQRMPLPSRAKPHRSQQAFAKEAARRVKAQAQSPDALVPHLPKEE
jgi:polyphosphate kinase